MTSGFGTFSIVGELGFILHNGFMFAASLAASYHSFLVFVLVSLVCHIISGFMARLGLESLVLFIFSLSVGLSRVTESALHASEK